MIFPKPDKDGDVREDHEINFDESCTRITDYKVRTHHKTGKSRLEKLFKYYSNYKYSAQLTNLVKNSRESERNSFDLHFENL